MIKPGEIENLKIARFTEHGAYLWDPDEKRKNKEEVLLPKKEIKEDFKEGDLVKVFIYLDSNDRIISTTFIPDIAKDGFDLLRVKDVTKIGAFLDWGLLKDLFLPYKEMTKKLKTGDEIIVRLYTDKSGRLSSSMKGLYHILKRRAPYTAGDMVSARIYEFGHDFGTFAAVDDKYSAMIKKHEDTSSLNIGDLVEARVVAVKEDGKLDISLRDSSYKEIDNDGEIILSLLNEYAGVLPFTEKADPAVIFRETGLSKAAFKRAAGRLYKERKIIIEDGKIRLYK